MRLTVIGCGDAFGSGGRLQTCYHVDTGSRRFLIDCGASTLIGLAREKLDPNAVDTILISHLHGDHFAGLVWWLLHGQHVSKRTSPLTITGPVGIRERFIAAAEALFPRSTEVPGRFAMTFLEYAREQRLVLGDLAVTPFEVLHPSGAPPYALRIEVGGRILSFSGDSEWVETLVPAGRDADLFIVECYNFGRESRYHMSWQTIAANLPRVAAKRVMLTHMNASMLANRDQATGPDIVHAEDGLVLEL